MDTNEAMFYCTQVLAALVHLHDKGIIHKDIKGKTLSPKEIHARAVFTSTHAEGFKWRPKY
jgi:serine/threonine protein kinase